MWLIKYIFKPLAALTVVSPKGVILLLLVCRVSVCVGSFFVVLHLQYGHHLKKGFGPFLEIS